MWVRELKSDDNVLCVCLIMSHPVWVRELKIEDMIIHRRKEQTVGKKAVYTDWINKLTSKINVAELKMDE